MNQSGKIEQCLQELGYVVLPIQGTSMWPLLREGKSRVQIASMEGQPLRKGDLVLFKREDGTLVLHRIIKSKERGIFLVCGDHQWRQLESIREDQIRGVAQGFYTNGNYIDDTTGWYRIYKKIWNGNLVLRRYILAFLRISGLERKQLQ